MKKKTKSEEVKKFIFHFYCRDCEKTFESNYKPILLICPFCKSDNVNITNNANLLVFKNKIDNICKLEAM